MSVIKTESLRFDLLSGVLVGMLAGAFLRLALHGLFQFSVFGAVLVILLIWAALWAMDPMREEPPLVMWIAMPLGVYVTFLALPSL
jgi:hypothetical protein